MPKIRLQIEEKLAYTRFMVIEFKDGMDIDQILNKVEKGSSSIDDMEYSFREYGVKIVENADDDLSSPDKSEVEIVDCVDLK